MRSVHLRSVELGSGRPKVCVSLLGTTVEGMTSAVAALSPAELDIVELRLDHVDGLAGDVGLVAETVRAVRTALSDDIPLIATFRSEREGGVQPISADQYVAVVETVISTGLVDAIDIEQFTPRVDLDLLVSLSKASGIAVIMSNHDFEATPSAVEIVERLLMQQALGADVVKIAVTPLTPADVVTLLAATDEFVSKHASVPTITMSMGPLGVISRVAGETFGSALSFGYVGKPGAPGQLEAGILRGMLEELHRSR